MASRYPPAWMDELRARSDLVQIVSGYVTLKKSGRRYWGLCPFHGEKTASFSVDSEHQLYYCFGCKAGGDVIHFIMEMERLPFPEAVQHLADRAHLPMPEMENDAEYERRRSMRERLLEANRQAARFYHETLFRPEGAASLAYLRRRGLSDSIIRKFGLGAAPDAWTSLTDHLRSQGFTLEELTAAGLTIVKPPAEGKKDPRVYDVFRNRAMFPIIDMYRNVIAFGGRALGEDPRKYLNTSDTPVFNKGKGVYAANLLRQQRHLDHVVLVEGYMDVISLTQFGVTGACATLGTALTNDQARLLHRFAPEVYLAYDGDSAGQHAILRGLDILAQEGIPARVLDFPDGLDPDEFMRRDGAEGFAKLQALSPTAYRIRRLKEGFDLSGEEARMTYTREAISILKPLDPVERDTYLTKLSVETGYSKATLLAQLEQTPMPEGARRPAVRPILREGQPGQEAPAEDIRAQEMLLGLLGSGQIPKDMIEEKDFGQDELKLIYERLMAGESPAELASSAPDDETRSRLTRIFVSLTARDKDEMIAMAQDCVSRIRRIRMENRRKELTDRLGQATETETKALLEEIKEITNQLAKM